ncbi:MAG: gamma-glutamylcyclotransferase family protein [Pseudomonadota bacterium]
MSISKTAPDDTDLLFVYGSLMPHFTAAFGRTERRRLAQSAMDLGPATTAGELLDLGQYPGLIRPTPRDPNIAEAQSTIQPHVAGRLLKLRRPAVTLGWLDRYEGITPGLAQCDYERVLRPVLCQTVATETLIAWVYIYTGSTIGSRRIQSGRWA